ncbi:MAG TPA: GNAT family N-acetyltransferase [Terriglobales bacterium]|nr:GNAT family N-acetyltransferase [Terriglobales bacterium]
MISELFTARLHLRSWRDSDRAPVAALNADPRVSEFLPTPLDAQASDAFLDRIECHWRENGFGLFAVEALDIAQFLGYIGLVVPAFVAPFTPCVEIGWRLAASHWGMGLATEGARAVMHHAFAALRLSEVLSWTVPANARSRRVMEKLVCPTIRPTILITQRCRPATPCGRMSYIAYAPRAGEPRLARRPQFRS